MRLQCDAHLSPKLSEHGFAIVTADSDFLDIARSRGGPPKVVRLENCTYKTAVVEALLRRPAIAIAKLDSSSRDILVIRR